MFRILSSNFKYAQYMRPGQFNSEDEAWDYYYENYGFIVKGITNNKIEEFGFGDKVDTIEEAIKDAKTMLSSGRFERVWIENSQGETVWSELEERPRSESSYDSLYENDADK